MSARKVLGWVVLTTPVWAMLLAVGSAEGWKTLAAILATLAVIGVTQVAGFALLNGD